MATGVGDGGENEATPGAEPGALTRLLEKLAEMPEGDEAAAWTEALRPGEALDQFEILRELGRGGFGAVYEALDLELGRKVAVKTLRPGRTRNDWADEQLRREAQAAAGLKHPGVVTLHAAGSCERGPYLVMELLQGETLGEKLSRGPVPVPEATEVALQVARALAHVHFHGLVHRDLKPENLHLGDDGRVKLLDLGLAHLLGGRSGAAGTPAYVAPEQWRGEVVDGRADVFALGAVLYEMVSGRRAFEVREERSAALDANTPPELSGRVPRRLKRLVARCLARDPNERPTAARAAEELLKVQQDLGRRTSTGRLALLVTAGGVLGMTLTGVAVWKHTRRAPAAGPDGRITVAVADFANETRESELDGLSGQLITSLEQSQRLRVLTRSRMIDVLRQSGRPGVLVVDEVAGREMALVAGVQALVIGTIRRFDQIYAIDLKVLDPTSSVYWFTLKEEQAGKAAIPVMLDRLSERVRERLRETRAEVGAARVAIAEATTQSYEAWQHYFEGQKLEGPERNEPALREYRKAVAADPRFALAHYRIAYLGEWEDVTAAERRAAMEAAYQEIDRVPARERLLLLAWKAHMEERDEDAHALYARAAESYPLDKEVQYLAGDLYLHEGRPAEALPWFERAVALDPLWPMVLSHLIVQTLPALGRSEEALVLARRWAERAPGHRSRRALVVMLAAVGRREEAVEVARRGTALEEAGWAATSDLAFALFISDRFEEAEALVRPFAREGAAERVEAVNLLLVSLVHQGRVREALRLVEHHRRLPGTPWGLGLAHRWNALRHARDPRPALLAAVALEEESDRQGSPDTSLIFWHLQVGDDRGAAALAARVRAPSRRKLYEALTAWRGGRAEVALEAIRSLDCVVPLCRTERNWWLAWIAYHAGHDREGIAATEEFEHVPMVNLYRGGDVAELLFRKALAQERLGEHAAAAATVERVLGWWRNADSDLAYLSETRALCARLGCGAGGGRAPR